MNMKHGAHNMTRNGMAAAALLGGIALAGWWAIAPSAKSSPSVASAAQAPQDWRPADVAAPQPPEAPATSHSNDAEPAQARVEPVAAPDPSKLERAKAAGVTVKVKKGETLIDLAADHLGSPDLWRDLLEVNADKIDKPEHLRAGMLVRLPEGVRPATAEEIRVSRFVRSIKGMRFDWYDVASGDTPASIAQGHYGDATKAAWIVNANADTFPTPPTATQPLTKSQRLRLPKEYVPGTGCGG